MTAAARPAGPRLAIILGLSALLFLAFAFGLRLVWFGAEAPLPALLENLPDSNTEADQEFFRARLDQAFPAGLAEPDLLDALAAQGFKRASPLARVATYDRRAGLNDKCQHSGNLRWSADATGRVTKLTGGYYQHCPMH
jgi:hypothetical protein